ncbi:MAG: hypothetical protein HLUCCO02_12865 [Idiomarinaceae bacterium HL-53]|nr:MAG: hypothetical protein HLUCCO02_12865 [Idiomarinaceae bacterium HL-53]CUS49353.1 hypothetical protein Ga0003345_2342 [Idiomarinaceae bacterium HL-53]
MGFIFGFFIWDDMLSKWIRGAPTKQDLQVRVEELESRVQALEERTR